MAAAFAGIANNGLTCTPVAIDRIVKSDGTEVTPPGDDLLAVGDPRGRRTAWRTRCSARSRAAAPPTASEHGHRRAAHRQDGTTDGAKDTWMIGASTKAATAVWVGNVVGRREPPRAELRQRRRGDGTSPHLARDHGARRQQVRRRRVPRARRRAPSSRCWSTCPRWRGSRSTPRSRRSRRPASSSRTAGSRTPTSRQAPSRHRPIGPGRHAAPRSASSRATARAPTVPDLTGMNALQAKAALDAGRPAR